MRVAENIATCACGSKSCACGRQPQRERDEVQRKSARDTSFSSIRSGSQRIVFLQQHIGNLRTQRMLAGSHSIVIQRREQAAPAPATSPEAPQAAPAAAPVSPAGKSAPATPAGPSLPAAKVAPATPAGPAPASASGGGAAAAVTPGPSAAATDAGSSEQILESLAHVPASQVGVAVGQARANSTAIQSREKADLDASLPEIDSPTGLPRSGRDGPSPPAALPKKGQPPEMPAPGARQGQPPETAVPATTAPLPGGGGAVGGEAPAQDDGGWWSWLSGVVRQAVGSIATTDPAVATSAGARPTVDLSGDADPNRPAAYHESSAASVARNRAVADQAAAMDFGEGRIAPTTPNEKLKPARRPGGAGPKGGAAGAAVADPTFDDVLAPELTSKTGQQSAAYARSRATFTAKSSALQQQTDREIEQDNESARAQQSTLRQQARDEVDVARQQWRSSNARAEESFHGAADGKRAEVDRQIQDKTQTAQTRADQELSKAETQAETERTSAETRAAQEKQTAETRPQSWWERFKGAVQSALDSVRKAVSGIFDAMRRKVREILQAAKTLARDIIEAARSAVVGLVKTFGEALKALVTVALAQFPELAAKARAWIDGKIKAAVDGVNRAAAALQRTVQAALDSLARTLDDLLSKLQTAFNTALDIVGALVAGLGNLTQLWNRFVAKVREVLPIPSDMKGAKHFLEQLRDAIKSSGSGSGSPFRAQLAGGPTDDFGTDNKGNAGGCGLCYGVDGVGPRDAGTAAHRLIQLEFSTQLLLLGLRPATEFVLPGVTPDLAFLRGERRLEVGEIKPDNPENIAKGRAKLARALPAARAQFPDKVVAPLGVPLQSSLEFPTLSTTPGCQVQKLFVKPPSDGLYLYFCEPSFKELKQAGCQCKDELRPPPVVATEKSKESIWERIKRRARENPVAAVAAAAAIVLGLATIVLLLLPEPVVTKIAGAVGLVATAAALVVAIIALQRETGGGATVA